MSLEAMERGEVIVYDVKGAGYAARFEDGSWWAWPAEKGGWQRRRPTKEIHVDTSRELSQGLAEIALRLSGVTDV